MKKVLSLLLTVMLLFALAVPAMPLEYTPSVEGAEAPEVVASTDNTGKDYDAIIDYGDHEVGVAKGEEYELVMTAVSERASSQYAEIKEALNGALNDVQSAGTVADLAPEVNSLLTGTEYKAEDFVISDLFDASLIDEEGVAEIPEGSVLIFKIKTDLKQGDIFFVLHNYAPGLWEVVENATLGENGIVTVKVPSASPFAVVKLGGEASQPVPGTGTGTGTGTGAGTGTIPASPQTGDSFPALYLVSALLCACAAVVLFKKAGKKA